MSNNYNFTTNEHYIEAKALYQPPSDPQWTRVHFGWLRDVNAHETFGKPEFYAKVTTWRAGDSHPVDPISDNDAFFIYKHPPTGVNADGLEARPDKILKV